MDRRFKFDWSGAGAAGLTLILIGFPVFPAVYACARVGNFHPVWKPAYYQWLREVPWHPGKPLPLGPVEPTVRDVMLLLAVSLAALATCYPLLYNMTREEALHWSTNFAAAVAGCGIGGYAYMTLRTLWKVGRQSEALAICGLFGFVLLLFPHAGAMLGVFVVAALLAGWRVRKAWDTYPWQLPPPSQRVTSILHAVAPPRGNELLRECKWLLAAQEPAFIAPASRRLVAILLSAWLMFCILHRLPPDVEVVGAAFMYWILLAIAAVRIALYAQGKSGPGFLARVALRRFIIPDYDKVWLIPTAGLLAAVFMHLLMYSARFPVALTVPITFAGAASFLFFAGPSLRNWHLTGAWNQHFPKTKTPSIWNMPLTK